MGNTCRCCSKKSLKVKDDFDDCDPHASPYRYNDAFNPDKLNPGLETTPPRLRDIGYLGSKDGTNDTTLESPNVSSGCSNPALSLADVSFEDDPTCSPRFSSSLNGDLTSNHGNLELSGSIPSDRKLSFSLTSGRKSTDSLSSDHKLSDSLSSDHKLSDSLSSGRKLSQCSSTLSVTKHPPLTPPVNFVANYEYVDVTDSGTQITPDFPIPLSTVSEYSTVPSKSEPSSPKNSLDFKFITKSMRVPVFTENLQNNAKRNSCSSATSSGCHMTNFSIDSEALDDLDDCVLREYEELIRAYEESLAKILPWLPEAEERIQNACNQPVPVEPKALQVKIRFRIRRTVY